MEHVYSGKIRDLYADDNGDLILVASDKVSVYDVVLPTPVPDKGRLLTQLSLWWFEQLADVVPNHVIGTDVPAEWAGRAVRCRPLRMLTVECIARGHLAGLGLQEYREHGAVSGVELPAGLVEGSRLPEPIFTPTTKATEGHDEFITLDDVRREFGDELTTRLRDITLEVYRRGAEIARERGIIIADTKLEFGIDADGELRLADEVLTSDSSRFWSADEWTPGQPQRSMDKQFIRDWASSGDWDRTPPGPEVPVDIVGATRARYIEAYERITGRHWEI
ncbi:MAG: phosphoribosylaminoimidazolesuccinocarboxamide synthase [Actinocatenispora sp.]